jgi:hypothetical protein
VLVDEADEDRANAFESRGLVPLHLDAQREIRRGRNGVEYLVQRRHAEWGWPIRVLPARVKVPQLLGCKVGDASSAVRGAIHGGVVHHDDLSVGGKAYV